MPFPTFPDPFKERETTPLDLEGYTERAANQEYLIGALLEAKRCGAYLEDFYHRDYEGWKSTYTYESSPLNEGEEQTVTSYNKTPISVQNGLERKSLNSIHAKLNRRANRAVDPDPKFSVKIDLSKKYTSYLMHFLFKEGTEKKDGDLTFNVNTLDADFDITGTESGFILAVQFSTKNAEEYMLLNKKFDNEFPNFEKYIIDRFEDVRRTLNEQSLDHSKSELKKIYNFYAQAPMFYISTIDIDVLYRAFFNIHLYDIEKWFVDTSDAAIKVLTAIIGKEGGTELLYQRFASANYGSVVKNIYDYLDGSGTSILHQGQTAPRKSIFAGMLWMIADDNNQWKAHPERDKRHIKFNIVGKNYVDSNIVSSDDDENKFDLRQVFYKTKRVTENLGGGYADGFVSQDIQTYDKPYWDYQPFQHLHPMDMVTLVMDGPLGGAQELVVPAIFVKDIAYHEEWAEVMKIVRLVVNIFIIVISLVTLIFGNPGPLMVAVSIIDLGLATVDIAVQAFAEEIAAIKDEDGNPIGQNFLDTWERIYFIGGIATGLPLLGNLLKGGGKLLLKTLSTETRAQLVIMLKHALSGIKNFPKFIKGEFVIIRPLSEVLGTATRQMQTLANEGVMLLKGTEVGSTIETYYLSYRNAIIKSGTLKNIKDEIRAIFKSGKDDLVRYLDELADGIASIRRGRYLGQVLEAADLAKIESFLKKYKVELQIGKGSGEFTVPGYFNKNGTPVMMKAKNAAMFITDGTNWKMILRKNATAYEFFHEFMHFQHARQLGKKNYLNIGSNFGEKIALRERFVYDKMVEYNRYLSRSELKHARNYMNETYEWALNRHSVDIPPGSFKPGMVELPFDLSTIPKKRQPINIDKLLKLN